MHLPPASWGPFFWHTMHIVALGYPSNPTYTDKKAAKEFYESLQFLIPCPICREHYSKFLQQQAITPSLDRRQDLFRWTVDIHNKVNQSLNKPRVSEQEAIAYYSRLGKTGRSPVWTADDFAEADMKAIIQGFALGVGVAAAAVASFWWVSKGES
jgi:hypothetical protein